MTDRSVARQRSRVRKETRVAPSLAPKNLIGIPWRVAFALQADGWHLRADIIWAKPSPMPESVSDRPTKAHEYVFLLAKSGQYFYDAEAISEEATGREAVGTNERRNRRSVWTVPSEAFAGAHFAVMPRMLVQPCILAGCPEGGTVLDPFAGSGTTGEVASTLGRNAILCELNPAYITIAKRRTAQESLFAGVATNGARGRS